MICFVPVAVKIVISTSNLNNKEDLKSYNLFLIMNFIKCYKPKPRNTKWQSGTVINIVSRFPLIFNGFLLRFFINSLFTFKSPLIQVKCSRYIFDRSREVMGKVSICRFH